MEKIKKIAITTLEGNVNYGNRLQNYALQTFILKNFKNVDVSTIANNPFNNDTKPVIKLYKSIKKFFKFDWAKTRTRYFNRFNKNIKFDKTKYYIENCNLINEKYDYVISGSDQVWNEEMSDNFVNYLLPFVDKEKRISYAASIAKDKLSSAEVGAFKRYLNTFNAISVREANAKKLLQLLTKKEIEVVVDPTLLLSKEDWQSVEKKPKFSVPKDYVLTCFLSSPNKDVENLITTLKSLGYKIIDIANLKSKYSKIGPAQFLYLERNASLILTDSFHAIVFSVINKVPVVHIERQGDFSSITARINNLERLFEVKFKTLKDVDTKKIDDIFTFDIKNTDTVLKEEKERAITFLTSAFSYKAEKSNNLLDVDFDCSGCGLCKNICPVKAISYVKNSNGFLQPKIDKTKCIKCGLCVRNCSQLREFSSQPFNKGIYAIKRKNKTGGNFSSTGFFGFLAKQVLSDNGVVFGVKYEKENSSFCKVENINDLKNVEGSKYFQVDISNIYLEVEKCLKDNKKVLIGATPCQIAGLSQKFKDNNNLILVQVVCHGVPPQKLFNDICNKKYGSLPESINFRNPEPSWENYSSKYIFEDEEIKIDAKIDSFMRCFLENKALNNCCYNCHYAGRQTNADVIIGDCWDIKNINKKFYTNKGVSIFVPCSNKISKYLNTLNDDFEIYKIPKSKYYLCNINLFKPLNLQNKLRYQFAFFEDVNIKDINELAPPEQLSKPIKQSLKNKIKGKIKKFLKI